LDQLLPVRVVANAVNVPKLHRYQIATKWSGNLGSGTSEYKAYSRDYEIVGPEKAGAILGSSDPAFRGDASRYNPEDLLVSAVSACHMLWVLHLCADSGIVVVDYSDQAIGEMLEHPDGSGEFTLVTLYPKMTITDGSRVQDAIKVHEEANRVCALARSVRFPVKHEPAILIA